MGAGQGQTAGASAPNQSGYQSSFGKPPMGGPQAAAQLFGQANQQQAMNGFQPQQANNFFNQQAPMGGKGQPGGQQLQVRSQPEVFNSPFSPQQREQYLQSENLANYPPIPQVQQPYGGFGQQPGMGGQPMTPPLTQAPLGMPKSMAQQLYMQAMNGQPMGGNPALTQQMRAGAANMTPQQMQNITQQMRAGAANMTPEQQAAITAQMRKGPQPNNPLAQPQQVRPEDARMQAMRGLQQLGDFKRYMG